MAIFRRKKANNKSVPPEVKKYYESEHRERVGLAWLIAFASLIVTVLVVAGLFFGGRWVYRQIAGDDNKTTTSNNDSNKNGSSTENGTNPQADQGPSDGSKSNDLQPATNPPTDGGDVAVDSDNNGSDSSSTSDATGPETGPSDSSQPENSTITDTGPGNTLAIFVAVTILATIAHWQYQRRRILN